MIITDPKWKSWIIETTTPLFTSDQCRQVIECGRRQKPQKAQVGMGRKPGGGRVAGASDTYKRKGRKHVAAGIKKYSTKTDAWKKIMKSLAKGIVTKGRRW